MKIINSIFLLITKKLSGVWIILIIIVPVSLPAEVQTYYQEDFEFSTSVVDQGHEIVDDGAYALEIMTHPDAAARGDRGLWFYMVGGTGSVRYILSESNNYSVTGGYLTFWVYAVKNAPALNLLYEDGNNNRIGFSYGVDESGWQDNIYKTNTGYFSGTWKYIISNITDIKEDAINHPDSPYDDLKDFQLSSVEFFSNPGRNVRSEGCFDQISIVSQPDTLNILSPDTNCDIQPTDNQILSGGVSSGIIIIPVLLIMVLVIWLVIKFRNRSKITTQ